MLLRLAAGYAGPPAPSLGRVLGHWTPQLLPTLTLALSAAAYLYGVSRLRARGDSWNPWRTAAWLTGLVVVAFALLSGLAAYDDVLFSVHAVQHMLLATVAPLPLALGAPVTLALRTLPPRPRAALLWVLHTRVARVLAFPLVGFALLTLSLFGLYFSSLYQLTLEHPLLHDLVHLHFLLAGCLFFWPMVGLDPLPGRLPYWGRMLVMFVTLPVHAILGLSILQTTDVFAASYYRTVVRPPWASGLLSDQRTGGGIMWAAGEFVGAAVFVALAVQWSRADGREAVREDRRLDRIDAAAARAVAAAVGAGTAADGGPAAERELQDREAAYNARLAALAAADRRPVPTRAAQQPGPAAAARQSRREGTPRRSGHAGTAGRPPGTDA